MELKNFVYQYNAGPFNNIKELTQKWSIGNCRRAVQLFFYTQYKIFLKPKQVLCPGSYYCTGDFIFTGEDTLDCNLLKAGDIIYAEKIRDKNNNLIDRSIMNFIDKDKYIIALHTALFVNKSNKVIWHATSIESKSCFWSWKKFNYYYKPVAVKRIVSND